MSVLNDQVPLIENTLRQTLLGLSPELAVSELGRLESVSGSVARVSGLPGVQSQEMLQFPGGEQGIALDLNEETIGVAMLSTTHTLKAGTRVERTGRLLDVPVGYALLGRVIAPDGTSLDAQGAIDSAERWPIERDAPAIIDRAPVIKPLETGIKVIDALIPVGHGQRELILGDRQTGKTTLAVDALVNQRDKNVIGVYCAIGQRSASVAKVIDLLKQKHAMARTVVVVASGDETAGMQYIAPYAATSIAEFFMHQGEDVLLVYDDLTRHARAYRELSLLLRRPPGREAFPGDIFYLHSRLLERSTHLRKNLGGGSLTALPIIETEAGNLSAYIPTNLISITDGQIYLSPDLFSKGQLPAIELGRSVSRVGGKTQLPAYRAATGDLRYSHAQFQELESFARFGTRLDAETRRTIEHGLRVRTVLKQNEHEPLGSCEQLVILLALLNGRFDTIALKKIATAESLIVAAVAESACDLCDKISTGQVLDDNDQATILALVDNALLKLDRQSRSQ